MASDNYRYAYGPNNELIDVCNLTKENKSDYAPFNCIGCREELIPHLGQKIKHHFKHKKGCKCSGETYLHNLAKISFFQNYLNCLNNDTPYNLCIPQKAVCDKHKATLGRNCERDIFYDCIDLTQYYDQVSLEKKTEQGFIADVLLSSSNNSMDDLLIEIVVTHSCSDEKIRSGHKIVELKISSEEDVLRFSKQIILPVNNGFDKNASVQFYNIETLRRRRNICTDDCEVYRMPVYILTLEGQIKSALISVEDVAKGFSVEGASLCRVYEPVIETVYGSDEDRKENINAFTREAIARGLNIRACTNCKHHGTSLNEHYAVWCHLKKEGLYSVKAMECLMFDGFRSIRQFDRSIERQKAFLSKNM